MRELDIPSLSFDYGKVLAPTTEELREGFRRHLIGRAQNDIEQAAALEARAQELSDLASRHRERAKALEETAAEYGPPA